MDTIWGGVLAFLFVLATLSGYGAGTPPEKPDKDKSEQSDKKDEDKKDEDKDKKEEPEKKDESSNHKSGKADKKDTSGHKGSPAKAPKKKAEYCIRDCPDIWTLRQ